MANRILQAMAYVVMYLLLAVLVLGLGRLALWLVT